MSWARVFSLWEQLKGEDMHNRESEKEVKKK
jgi:hypothetical protein